MSQPQTVRRARLVRSHFDGFRRVERTLKTATIPHTGDPAALIAAAARLRPRAAPVELCLFIMDAPVLQVSLEHDVRGRQVYVSVALVQADVPVLMAYLQRCGADLVGAMRCAYVADDGGEGLPLPPISAADLAAMPVVARVV